MAYQKSNFARLIEAVCKDEDIKLNTYSYDWAHRMEKDGKVRYIVGYQFPLNLSSVKEVCQDKALTYSVLTDCGIPASEHIYLPNNLPETGQTDEDNDRLAEAMLKEHGTIVVKDNSGTGGNMVFKAKNMDEYHDAIRQIFTGSYGASISPFLEIENEFRVIMLDGEPQITIRKDRAFELDENGNKVYKNWKHNLGQGATGVILMNDEVPAGVHDTAKKAVRALGARFVSVDVISVGGELMILEINGGVMMEHLSGQSEEYFELAKSIYKKAIIKAFEVDDAY